MSHSLTVSEVLPCLLNISVFELVFFFITSFINMGFVFWGKQSNIWTYFGEASRLFCCRLLVFSSKILQSEIACMLCMFHVSYLRVECTCTPPQSHYYEWENNFVCLLTVSFRVVCKWENMSDVVDVLMVILINLYWW